MIKPLSIGKSHFQTNIIQAPLAGVSCAPFRSLIWQFPGVAYCCTEMLSASNLANAQDRSPRYYTRLESEGPTAFQLSTKNPDILARACEKAILYGADILDLNCGCPQPKIRKKGCGSKLLTQEKTLKSLVHAMQIDPNVPVTVKIRIDANRHDFCEITLAKMLEEAGCNAIIVHGRHWTHDYTKPVLHDTIAKVVSAVSIPVIANGDIDSLSSLKKIHKNTNCAGYMIGRATIGKPWLFEEIIKTNQNIQFNTPKTTKIGEIFLEHIEGLVILDGEQQAIMQSRRLGRHYAKHLSSAAGFIQHLNTVKTFNTLVSLVDKHFK